MKKFLNNRNEKLFNKLFEKQGISIKELDVAKMTAWQALEEEDETQAYREAHGVVVSPPDNENDPTATDIAPGVTDVPDVEDAAMGDEDYELGEALQKGALEKIERAFKPIAQTLKSIDTTPELEEFLSAIIHGIEELSNGGLKSQEVVATFKKLLNQKPDNNSVGTEPTDSTEEI